MIQKSNKTGLTAELASQEFTIAKNDSMFQLLTSNLYSDTIKAPIREWSTNAIDACLEANKPINFYVHIPTPSEPTFYVRDYGSGLSEEDLLGLFTVLGESTKRDSNLYNGTFGIGRLAGLAYAQSFTVESYHKGNYYSYLISMSTGVPIASRLAASSTTEPDGLKLSLPVQQQDVYAFRVRALKLFKFFEVLPETNIDLPSDHNAHNSVTDNWSITDGYQSYLVMANVAYEIDFRLIDDHMSSIILYAPTGSVSINPNRESLSMNDSTKEYLTQRFAEVKKEYIEIANEAIAGKPTPIKQLAAYDDYCRNSPSTNMANAIDIPSSPVLDDLLVRSGRKHIHPTVGNINFRLVDTSKSKLKLHKISPFSIAKFTRSDFILVDRSTNFNTAIQAIVDLDHQKQYILIQRTTGYNIDEFTSEAKKLLEDLGVSSYYLVSDYYKKPDRNYIPKTEDIYCLSRSPVGTVFYNSSVPSPDDEYLYVPLSGYNAVLKDENCWYAFYRYLCKSQGYKKQYVGVQQKYLSKVKKLPNFTLAVDELKDLLPNTHINVGEFIYQPTLSFMSEVDDAPEDIKLQIKEQEYFKERDWNKYCSLHELERFKRLNFNISYTIHRYTHNARELKDKYPLLKENLCSQQTAYYMKLEKLNVEHNSSDTTS